MIQYCPFCRKQVTIEEDNICPNCKIDVTKPIYDAQEDSDEGSGVGENSSIIIENSKPEPEKIKLPMVMKVAFVLYILLGIPGLLTTVSVKQKVFFLFIIFGPTVFGAVLIAIKSQMARLYTFYYFLIFSLFAIIGLIIGLTSTMQGPGVLASIIYMSIVISGFLLLSVIVFKSKKVKAYYNYQQKKTPLI